MELVEHPYLRHLPLLLIESLKPPGFVKALFYYHSFLAADSIRPWTVPEQRALEKALRNNPARPNEPPAERWQRIADEVGTRTRRECMLRFKDLAEQVRWGDL